MLTSVFARIAGLRVAFGNFPAAWNGFLTDTGAQPPDVRFETVPVLLSAQAERRFSWNDLFRSLKKKVECYDLPDGQRLLCNLGDPTILPVCCSADYSRVQVICPDDTLLANADALDLLRIPIECRFIHESIVSLHAACVEEGSCAVCFTGDSGVGKSTRAKTWVDALGAEFISGDRPAVRLEENGSVACGVPWDGKEQIFRNVERPLRAILEVRRAPFTRLRRLSVEQAYRVLVRQCFIPMWDPDTAALAMVNVKRLCRITPVYRLFCGPDAEAARETRRILFDCSEEIQEELPDMKIREGFVLRNVADEHMVMPTGENVGKFGGAVVLSDVAAFAFEQLRRPVSREDLLSLILAEYDVDAETATADLDALLAQFREMNLLED